MAKSNFGLVSGPIVKLLPFLGPTLLQVQAVLHGEHDATTFVMMPDKLVARGDLFHSLH